MAKKSYKTFWTAAGVILVILLTASGVLITFTEVQATTEAVGDKFEVIKNEGCLPARDATSSIRVIESKLATMETVQTTRHTEIMAELRKKPPVPP